MTNGYFRDPPRPELEHYTLMQFVEEMSQVLINEIFLIFKTEPDEKAREFVQKQLDFYKNNPEAKKALENFYARKTAREFFDQDLKQIPFALPQVMFGQFNVETLFPSIFITFFEKVIMDEIRNVTARLNMIGRGVVNSPAKLLTAALLTELTKTLAESFVDVDRFFTELCQYYEIGILPTVLEPAEETPAGEDEPPVEKKRPPTGDNNDDGPDKFI